MPETLDVRKLPDMDLVNIVNQTEGFSWRLNHDAADGRIPNEGVDDSIQKLMETRDKAVAEIERRTGISGHEEMREYISRKLKEQDDMWDIQWSEIYNEGAVFHFPKLGDPSHFYETVRRYLPATGCIGPQQIILARPWNSRWFREADEREIPNIKRIEGAKPIYSNISPVERGLIKVHEEPIKRRCNDYSARGKKDFNIFYHQEPVFEHKGFWEIFETIDRFTLPDVEISDENQVILARSHSRPIFVEFTPSDLHLMEVAKIPRKYNTGYQYNLDMD